MTRRSFLNSIVPPDPSAGYVKALLDRWQHTCRKHLLIEAPALPWLVLYDRESALHVNSDRGALKAPHRKAGQVAWAGRTLGMQRVKNGAAEVWLPNGETIPAGLGAAVKPWPKNGRKDSAIFVQLPLPSLFRSETTAGISDLHWYSLALHELTHTLQFHTVLRQWRALQAKFEMPQAADDDMIEFAFRENAEYVSIYNREKELLQQAVFAASSSIARKATRESLTLARERQRRFFKPGWIDAEALWLSLEGCALWVQARAEIDSAPAGQPWQQTAMGLAGFMGRWSQEHGAGLFWMIDQLVPDWKPRYFGSESVPSPFDVLEAAL